MIILFAVWNDAYHNNNSRRKRKSLPEIKIYDDRTSYIKHRTSNIAQIFQTSQC
jgi:hypothetical protein